LPSLHRVNLREAFHRQELSAICEDEMERSWLTWMRRIFPPWMERGLPAYNEMAVIVVIDSRLGSGSNFSSVPVASVSARKVRRE
jgi:hypothetical protein